MKHPINVSWAKGARAPYAVVIGHNYDITAHITDNVLITGAANTGRTTLAQFLVAQLMAGFSPADMRFMVLDCNGKNWDHDLKSPHLDMLACAGDADAALRVLKRAAGIVQRRAMDTKYDRYFPQHFLVVDLDHALFSKSSKSVYAMLVGIMTAGPAVGVHTILVADATRKLTAPILDTCSVRLCTRTDAASATAVVGTDAPATFNNYYGQCYVKQGATGLSGVVSCFEFSAADLAAICDSCIAEAGKLEFKPNKTVYINEPQEKGE